MGILSAIKNWFVPQYESDKELEKYRLEREAKKMSDDVKKEENTLSELPSLVANMSPGDISMNHNYRYIQEIGQYLSPNGKDSLHTVVLMRRTESHSETIARIDCTNSMYSEWLIACCETMWKTNQKVAYDIHGNIYPLGKMLQFDYEIDYPNDK